VVGFVLALKQKLTTILQVAKFIHKIRREGDLTSAAFPFGVGFPHQHTGLCEVFSADA